MINNKKEVVLEFNLPNFEREDLDIKLSENSLIIRGLKKHKRKIKQQDFFHYEKSAQKFYYATTLPKINKDKAKIEFKKGILKIKVPKIP